VFRNGEQGACHNPEFTLLEWYRTGFDHLDLMDEVERLLREVLDGIMPLDNVQHWCYRDLFQEITGIDPLQASTAELAALLESDAGHGVVGMTAGDRDAWLDLVMTHLVEPHLGNGLVFIRDYPASQAALARLRSGNPPVASRFEVYLNGIELANGFHELADADEQARRFAAEQAVRLQQGLAAVPRDERLLAALEAGLPDCAGVALGIDRLLMLACGAGSLQEVMAFPFENA
jgi:lysyl-tRNA synthetase class 2